MINELIGEIKRKHLNFNKIKQVHDGESALMISNVRLLIADRIEELTAWSTDTEINIRIECIKTGPTRSPTFFIRVMHLEGSTYEILPASEFSIYSIETNSTALTINYQYNQHATNQGK